LKGPVKVDLRKFEGGKRTERKGEGGRIFEGREYAGWRCGVPRVTGYRNLLRRRGGGGVTLKPPFKKHVQENTGIWPIERQKKKKRRREEKRKKAQKDNPAGEARGRKA